MFIPILNDKRFHPNGIKVNRKRYAITENKLEKSKRKNKKILEKLLSSPRYSVIEKVKNKYSKRKRTGRYPVLNF